MMRKAIPALLLSVMLTVCGCASGAQTSEAAYDSVPAAESAVYSEESASSESYGYDAADSVQSAEQPADAGVRKIVYTANLELTCDDPAEALEEITQKALSLGGYIASSDTYTDDDGPYRSTASLKVPSASLDALVAAAEGAGTVDSYSLNSDDISLSYYDIQARLTSAEAEETQLLTILAQCETVEDLLAVRAELAKVRADIESYQAQINLWDNLVDYATLEITIRRTAKTPVEAEKSLIELWRASDVWENITFGFQNSARFVVNAIGAIGIFLAYAIIPCAILFACIGVPIIVHHKRKKRRAAAKAQAEDVLEPSAQPPQQA